MGTFKNTEFIIKSSFQFPCSYIQGKFEKRLCVNILKTDSKQIISELTKKDFEEITTICIYLHAKVVILVYLQE